MRFCKVPKQKIPKFCSSSGFEASDSFSFPKYKTSGFGVKFLIGSIQFKQFRSSVYPCLSMFFTNNFSKPIQSMYGIFTYIYRENQPNLSKYTIHGLFGIHGCQVSRHFYQHFFETNRSHARELLQLSQLANTFLGIWDMTCKKSPKHPFSKIKT